MIEYSKSATILISHLEQGPSHILSLLLTAEKGKGNRQKKTLFI